MAVQLPQGLYSHYTNVFDTTPLMQANLQRKQHLEAKKQAKEEALNQYFNELPNKLNTAGVRQQDLYDPKYGGITKEIEDWSTQWKLNADAIKRGGVAQQEHMARYNNILRKIDQAKQRAKFELELGKARFEGKYNPDDDDFNVLQNVGKSIYDPTSYKDDGVSEYGWQDLSPSTPDLDIETESKAYDLLTKNLTPIEKDDYSRRVFDKERGEIIIPRVKEYTTQQKKFAADAAVGMVVGNSDLAKKLRKSYNRLLDGSIEESENGSVSVKSKELEELDKYYKSVYGEDKFISNAEQVAQAKAIKRLADATTEKPKEDVNYGQRQQDKRININLNTNNNTPTQMTGNAFDMMPDADYKNFNIRGGYIYNKDGTPYTTTGGTFISGEAIPAVIISALKSGGIDTKYLTRGVNAVVKDGVIQSISNKSIGTITREAMEGVYQKKMDTERKGESLNFQPAKPGQPKKKTYKGLDKNGNPIFE